MPKRISWEPIRADYIMSNLSYPEIAQKWQVSVASVEVHARQESWGELRRNHRLQQSMTVAKVNSPIDVELIECQDSNQPVTLARLDSMIDMLLNRCEVELQTVPVRSFERAIDAFEKLVNLRLRLRPPTPGIWADVAIGVFGLNAKELFAAVKTEWEAKSK